jgi:hypothetical protein
MTQNDVISKWIPPRMRKSRKKEFKSEAMIMKMIRQAAVHLHYTLLETDSYNNNSVDNYHCLNKEHDYSSQEKDGGKGH